MEENVVYAADRPFNDLRYPLDCSRLVEMGCVTVDVNTILVLTYARNTMQLE